jgi:hypothetical protein
MKTPAKRKERAMWRTHPNYELFGALLFCGVCLVLMGLP